MIGRLVIFLLLLLNFCDNLNAQAVLKGKIYEAGTDSLINAVTVFNKNSKLSVHSGSDGSYTIMATEGDRIIFSSVGFTPDTITVTYDILLTQHDITLSVRAISLKPVTVISSYTADSLARRDYYQYIHKKQPGITGFNTPQYGVGISISPASYFSAESRKKRQLKKRLIKNEEESFIDYSFPAEWVEKLTGLHGDSLRLFMYRYRPSHLFCRKTSREDMLIYVSDKLREFRKPEVRR